jgi:hypothetical protein
MNRAAAALFALATLPGCFVYADSDAPGPRNTAPYFTYAEAGCYPDDYYHDFVWYFDADVQDGEGANDVSEVYADVFDSWTGEWVDGFELYPEGGVIWYSAWVGSSTWLDCTYAGYEVDFTAVDIFGATDVVTVIPATW